MWKVGLGLDSVSPTLCLGLNLVSAPKSFGLVSVSIHSGLDLDSSQVVLTTILGTEKKKGDETTYQSKEGKRNRFILKTENENCYKREQKYRL